MGDLEHTAACPSCRRHIRITEAELLDKRGFCAACGARFDLLPEMFVGDGPMRALQVVRTTLPALPPTSKIRVVRDDDGNDTVIVESARPFPVKALGFSVFWFGFLALWYSTALGSGRLLLLLFPLLHVAAGLWIMRHAIRDLRGRDLIKLHPDGFEIERRGALLTRTNHVSFNELREARVEEQRRGDGWDRGMRAFTAGADSRRVLLIRDGADPIAIGDGLGHEAPAAEWLAAWVEQTLRDRRR